MSKKKFYAGVICGHQTRITEEDDSFLVEVAGDVVGDVCTKCYVECNEIHNVDGGDCYSPYMDFETKEYHTQYFFKGTIIDLQNELGVFNKVWDYLIPTTNNLYSSWEYGEVTADTIEEATEKAKAKLRADFEEVNRAISKFGKRIDCDFDSVEVKEQKNVSSTN